MGDVPLDIIIYSSFSSPVEGNFPTQISDCSTIMIIITQILYKISIRRFKGMAKNLGLGM